MYLAFKNFKIKRKQGNQSNKNEETSTTDAFGVSSSGNKAWLMSLEVEMHRVRAS